MELTVFEIWKQSFVVFYLIIKDKQNTDAAIKKLLDIRTERLHQGKKCPEIIVVDALERPSASKLR